MMMKRNATFARLLGATAISVVGLSASAQGIDDCGADFDVLPIGCEPANAGSAVAIPVGANTENATSPATGPQGFVISINGNAIAGDTSTDLPIRRAVRRTDVALANADVQVTFDGLGATPRLDLETVGINGPVRAGDVVTLQSALNYPAYVSRAEVRIIDLAALGGPRTLAVTPIAPNGSVNIVMPQGKSIVAVHRVYDAAGRYDETAAVSLQNRSLVGGIEGVEDGADNTARRRIPVGGGAITVRGTNVAAGARVLALGEAVKTDRNGSFVLQRILPAGDYGVDVSVTGAGQAVNLTRDVTIPRSEWFTVGTVDLTYGQRTDGLTNETSTYATGRAAFYADGKTQNGVRITASVDTGEGPLDEIFRNLDARDPRTLLDRVDPRDLYPTYGDDSTSEDRTPTAGKIFVRIEKEANFVQWGNFDSDLGDNGFVRNDRALYGLSAGFATQDQTSAGEARARVLAYAAQPDMLPQRDTFLGTGGTVFFLDRQDIAAASETISIQLRDPDTGRVTETRVLVAGRDYEVNYIQGIVSLSRPLQSVASDGLFTGGTSSDAEVVLVAQYEYQPDAGDLDGYAYGGRAEGWVTDNLRVGVSGMQDETGATDHQLVGADVLYQVSDETYVRLEYAKSKGTGFDSTFSADGGLIVSDVVAAGTQGEAIKVSANSSLVDLGLGMDGAIGGYFEKRTAGFSSLDTQTTAVTGDEQFFGVYADAAVTDRVTVGLTIDSYQNGVGEKDVSGRVEATIQASDTLSYAVGIENQNRSGGTDPGQRTDVAARVTFAPNDDNSVYVFGQATVRATGLDDNNRYGIGGTYGFGNGWGVSAEISDGTTGVGGRIGANYSDDLGNTRYAGYEIDPNRSLDGIDLRGRDQGRFVVGGREQINDQVAVFGENSYDMFGRHKSLTAAYGLDYQPTDVLRLTTAFEMGQVRNGDTYDFDRKALSFGVIFEDEVISASGRLEYRTEEGVAAGVDVASDTLLLSASASYKIDDVQRVVIDADLARSETDQSDLLDGNYADVVLGYAYRPIEDDRLNILARYRYLYDLYGLRDATGDEGPRQRSHVMSVDASYDVDRNWTIGGKLGYRSTQSAMDGTSAFTDNNAWLAVANARYHLVHDWDALIEVRSLGLEAAGTTETGVLGAVYKHLGNNVKLGVGYNFGTFSDDLTDLTHDDQGAFINLIAKF